MVPINKTINCNTSVYITAEIPPIVVYKVAKIPIITMQYISGIPVVIFKAIEGAYITKPNQASLNIT